MPRYLVEQTYPDRFSLPLNTEGVQWVAAIAGNNALEGVTWLHSYIVIDKRRAFCLCEAPTPEAVRRAAERNGLPVDRILEVRVLDPYFYL
jgi:hypothetical protein